ncbi:MAG: hypothetical protein QM527_07880 [Alphaproteobacteria bacterium]|nr:hypothetical protein [Alphaproteobacteria bacterium]
MAVQNAWWRIMAQKLGEKWRISVVEENRAGASGNVNIWAEVVKTSGAQID